MLEIVSSLPQQSHDDRFYFCIVYNTRYSSSQGAPLFFRLLFLKTVPVYICICIVFAIHQMPNEKPMTIKYFICVEHRNITLHMANYLYHHL